MFRVLKERWKQGHRTIQFPKAAPVLPELFRGAPLIDTSRCPADCEACSQACPTKALSKTGNHCSVDLGRCLFCPDCSQACPHKLITYSRDHRLSARRREDLLLQDGQTLKFTQSLDRKMKSVFGRSLKLRQVSAGGCNGCEADVNVLNTLVFDLGRFGVQFVASPRHADGLLITGPVTKNMQLALQKTYDAVPSPKLVIAVGACAVAGGPYFDHEEVHPGAGALLKVDLFIPGCPPHPITILDGILRLLGRL